MPVVDDRLRENGPDALVAHSVDEADTLQVDHPSRFKPAGVDHVVHVLEGVHFAPGDGDAHRYRVAAERSVHESLYAMDVVPMVTGYRLRALPAGRGIRR